MSISNPDHVQSGVKRVWVDGKAIRSNRVPLFGDGALHTIDVVMGHAACGVFPNQSNAHKKGDGNATAFFQGNFRSENYFTSFFARSPAEAASGA